MFSVIILAAGSASRMEGINKQLAQIDGIPVFILSALKFQHSEMVSEIIIAAPEGDIPQFTQLARSNGITKLKCVVKGGNTRALSVQNSLSHVSEGCRYIAVHDGARPLITTDDINRVLNDAVKYGASIAAAPATDTVKIAADGIITDTPPRNTLYYAQTPQAFDKAEYLFCCKTLGDALENATDDSSIFEQCGKKVHITEITACNMKITRPADLVAARAIYKGELL